MLLLMLDGSKRGQRLQTVCPQRRHGGAFDGCLPLLTPLAHTPGIVCFLLPICLLISYFLSFLPSLLRDRAERQLHHVADGGRCQPRGRRLSSGVYRTLCTLPAACDPSAADCAPCSLLLCLVCEAVAPGGDVILPIGMLATRQVPVSRRSASWAYGIIPAGRQPAAQHQQGARL
jgi:hypothetical protein